MSYEKVIVSKEPLPLEKIGFSVKEDGRLFFIKRYCGTDLYLIPYIDDEPEDLFFYDRDFLKNRTVYEIRGDVTIDELMCCIYDLTKYVGCIFYMNISLSFANDFNNFKKIFVDLSKTSPNDISKIFLINDISMENGNIFAFFNNNGNYLPETTMWSEFEEESYIVTTDKNIIMSDYGYTYSELVGEYFKLPHSNSTINRNKESACNTHKIHYSNGHLKILMPFIISYLQYGDKISIRKNVPCNASNEEITYDIEQIGMDDLVNKLRKFDGSIDSGRKISFINGRDAVYDPSKYNIIFCYDEIYKEEVYKRIFID